MPELSTPSGANGDATNLLAETYQPEPSHFSSLMLRCLDDEIASMRALLESKKERINFLMEMCDRHLAKVNSVEGLLA